jgi:putative membrane protein
MWEWHGTGMMGGGFMWLFWILIVFVAVLLIKAASGNSSSNEQRETPLEILEKRYARGEIDEEEFQRRKKELSG